MILATFLIVTVAWVPFRAPSLDVAFSIMSSMAGTHGDVLESVSKAFFSLRQAALGYIDIAVVVMGDTREPVARLTQSLAGDWSLFKLYVCALIAFFLPNTAQIFTKWRPVLETNRLEPTKASWSASFAWAFVIAAMFVVAILDFSAVSPFLYFQF